jgi:hypothetical protein
MTEKPNIQEIGEKASQAAEVLLKKSMDSVISLCKEQEGWLAEVEVVERKSVPDTQDILGRYEMKFNEVGELQGYRRIKLRRRLDREEITDEEV